MERWGVQEVSKMDARYGIRQGYAHPLTRSTEIYIILELLTSWHELVLMSVLAYWVGCGSGQTGGSVE
jgi:hypothetical protein